MEFLQALENAYLHAPCQVLPNALWKTRREFPSARRSFKAKNGQVTELRLWDAERLLLYWKPQVNTMDFSEFDLAGLKLALVHARALPYFPAKTFSHRTPYFRYLHLLDSIEEAAPPSGCRIQPAHPEAEAEEIATLISHCYPHITVSANQVQGWTKHPVYDPALWLWLVDEASGHPAALGIAEFDPTIKEGSLEWVQVLPAYRRRGLGATLVLALLGQLAAKARFATVSGEVENQTNPGALYRRCGFTGDDIWWVFTK